MTPVPPVTPAPRGNVHVSLAGVLDFFAQRRKAVVAFLASAGPVLAATYLGPPALHVAHVWYVVAMDGLATLGVHAVANKGQGGAS